MEAKTATEPATEPVVAPAAADGETIEVRRPADGTLIQTLPIDPPERVREVVSRVRAAQPAWERLGFDGRRRRLERWRDWILDHDEEIADLMQEETGKVRVDAHLEAPVLCDEINFYTEHGPGFIAEERPRPHILPMRVKKLRVVYRPYPVVGVISPWNFPLLLSAGDSVPALMAGAGVVIKPSELTPLTLMRLVEAWRETGGPDVLAVVNGMGDTGGALVDEVDFIQFTGSERTGKVVMKRAAETLTPVSLELGGKDPMIVLKDANLERSVNAAAWGGLVNTGQVCMSIERVYVEEPIYDEFVEKLADKVRKVRQGADGRSYTADVGAMTSPAQVEIVEDHVEDARKRGARVLTGGRRGEGPGAWYQPTVIADVDHSMKVMRDETFGPVVPVMKVSDAEEAVRLANDSPYGLSATVMAGDNDEGERIARRIECGAVNVNDVLRNYQVLSLPMGGWKTSGIGFRHGAYGIRKFVRPESITVPSIPTPKSELIWFPYSARKRKAVSRLYRFFNARGLRDRLGIGKRG
jgi:acyl-CoA reductase-like NAD-dependent aldehyde dehydrogenase